MDMEVEHKYCGEQCRCIDKSLQWKAMTKPPIELIKAVY